MAKYVLRITTPDKRVRNVPLNQLIAVPAQQGTKYALVEPGSMKMVEGVSTKASGDNLIIEVNHQPVVHINRYYLPGQNTILMNDLTSPLASTGQQSGYKEPAQTVDHLPADKPAPTHAESGGFSLGGFNLGGFSMGGNWTNVLIGGAAVGGLLALASGKSSDKSSSSATPVNSTVYGTVVAGPIINGKDLRVALFKADGSTPLSDEKSGSVSDSGQFSISVTNYSGVVIAKLLNKETATLNYLDEVSNTNKDFTMQLFAATVVNGGSVKININPLTTLAYLKMGSNPIEATVKNVNAAIAKLVNVTDLHDTTVIPVNGFSSTYNVLDGVLAGETYGAYMAALSGLDKLNSGNSQTTIDALVSNTVISGTTASFNSTATSDINKGALEYDKVATTEKKSGLSDNTAPVFTSGATANAIAENSGSNQSIYTATATDKNTVSYSLKDSNSALSIDASTGVVTLLDNPNYEQASSYGFTVVAKDPAGNSAEKAVTLSITNKDETAPTISSADTVDNVKDGATTGTSVYTVVAADPSSDGGPSTPLTYSVRSGVGDDSYFTINSSTGEVKFAKDTDYTKTSQLNVTVVAQDAAGNQTAQAIRVNLISSDTTAPTVSSLALSSDSEATYSVLNAGDSVNVTVSMSENVTVTGTPQLGLKIGTTDVLADYVSVSGKDMTFKYTLLADQNDSDGISIAANAFNLNGATIKDTVGNAATITHAAVADNSSYKVDNTAATPALVNPIAQVALEATGNTTGQDVAVQLAAVGTGYVTVWQGTDSAGDNSIFVQKLNSDGSLNGSQLQLEAKNKVNGSDETPQLVALGSSGDFVVVWSGEDSDSVADNSIFVQKINADGTSATLVQLEALSKADGDDINPQVAALSSGFVVVWQGIDSAGDNSIFVQKFDSSGVVSGSTIQLEALNKADGADIQPQVTAVGSSGEFVVTWSGVDSASDSSIFVQKFASNGSASGSTIQLEAANKTDGADGQARVIALGSGGEFAVSWIGVDSAGDNSVFLQKFSAAGAASGSLIQLEANNKTDGQDNDVRMAALSNGELLLSWSGDDSVGDRSVFVSKVKTDGTANTVQLEAPLKTNGVDQFANVLALGNDYAVAWWGENSSGSNSVLLQKFNSDGSLGPLTQFDYATAGAENPQLAALGSEFALAWSAPDSGTDKSIVFQKFSSAGNATNNAIASAQGSVNVSSNETGTLYLVNDSINAKTLTDITGAADAMYNAVTIATANSSTALATTGLTLGSYKLYSLDAAGNLSSAAANTVSVVNSGMTLSFSSSGVQNDTLNTGDILTVTAALTDSVTVTGTPQIELKIGSTLVKANYVAGSSTATSLAFQYTIESGQIDSDGVSLAANSLSLNGGTIKNNLNSDVSLTHTALSDDAHFKVDTSAPVATLAHSYAATQSEATANTTGEDNSPRLASIGAGGDYVLSWAGKDSNSNFSVYVQKFASDGTAGNIVQLKGTATTGSFSDGMAQVSAVGDSGEFAAVWVGENEQSLVKVYLQKFNADGSTNGAAMVLQSAAYDLNYNPQLVSLGSNGELLVTWWGMDSQIGYHIYVQKVNADNSLGSLVTLEGQTGAASETDWSPQIATINGEYAVCWSGKDSGSDMSIFVQRFNSDGSKKGSLLQLEAIGKTDGEDSTPKLIALGDSSGYAVTWYGVDSAGDYSVFVQKINTDGTTTSAVQLEATGNTSGSDVSSEILSLGSNGEFVVAWTGENSTDNSSIYVQKFNANGTVQGSPVKLDGIGNSTGLDVTPQLAAIGTSGEYAVTWSGVDSAGDYSIFVQKFKSDGTVNGSSMQLEAINKSDGADITPTIIASGNTGAMVVGWAGIDSAGDNSIFTQKISGYGNTVNAPSVNSSGSINVSSSEVGAAYLVNATVTVSNLSSITQAADNLQNTVALSAANTTTALSASGLLDGSYRLYTADAAGNLSAAFDNLVTIDTSAPSVSSIAILSAPTALNSLLNTGDRVNVAVTFNEAVYASGTTQLTLNVGGTNVLANYISGNGSNALIFQYTILAGQSDSNGISIAANALAGTIKDAAGNAATLTHSALTDNASYKVDGIAPTASATTATIAPSANASVQSDETGTVYLVHSNVTVTKLTDISNAADNLWNSISISTAGVATNLAATGLMDGVYKVYSVDAAGNLSAAASNTITVESGAPTVSTIELSGATGWQNNYLNKDDVIYATATMSENVTITGTPQLTLNINGNSVVANYDSARSTQNFITFSYTILTGQDDSNGISIAANSLSLNGGSIKDSFSNDAVLTHSAIADNASYMVDNTAPSITSSATATSIAENSGANQKIYSITCDDSQASFSIKSGTGDATSFTLVEKDVYLTPNPDFEAKASYSFTLVATDTAGNSSEKAVTLGINDVNETGGSANIVVFDLVSGTSSAHSSRAFDANTKYTIYIRVSSTSHTLSIDGDGPGAADTWGKWTGADKLGTDDKVILVGDGAAVKGEKNGVVSKFAATSKVAAWGRTGNSTAAMLLGNGTIWRYAASQNQNTKIWSGAWKSPDKTLALGAVYLTKMPNGILTSQGLA